MPSIISLIQRGRDPYCGLPYHLGIISVMVRCNHLFTCLSCPLLCPNCEVLELSLWFLYSWCLTEWLTNIFNRHTCFFRWVNGYSSYPSAGKAIGNTAVLSEGVFCKNGKISTEWVQWYGRIWLLTMVLTWRPIKGGHPKVYSALLNWMEFFWKIFV